MFDLLIKGGSVCDGSGAAAYTADIAVKDGQIAAIGTFPEETAQTVIHAAGKTVTPGFIDPHTHVDKTILLAPELEPYLKQGVTTVVTGNCGQSPAPLGDEVFYGSMQNFQYLEQTGADLFEMVSFFQDKARAKKAMKEIFSVDLDWDSFGSFWEKAGTLPLGGNIVPLAGYNAIRTAVMGKDCLRPARPDELKQLELLTERCMEQGAFGLSTGRDPNYVPGPWASDEEMIPMLRIVKKYDRIFPSHTYNVDSRGKNDRMGGYREMMGQAKAAQVRSNVSHVHISGMAGTAREAALAAERTLEYFHQVRQEGVDLSFDIIPDVAFSDFTLPYFSFFLKGLVVMSGSRRQLARNFRREEFRQMVRQMVRNGKMAYFNPDVKGNDYWFSGIMVTRHQDSRFLRKTLMGCAQIIGKNPLESIMDLFAEDPDMAADFLMEDYLDCSLDVLFSHPLSMPCSDGQSYPRTYNWTGSQEVPIYCNATNAGFMPEYLRRFGKQDFEEAVRRATSLPARRFGIRQRGEIAVGNYADLVVLDRERLKSFGAERDPEGIEYVIVNGEIAARQGQLTGSYKGQVLRPGR